MSLIAGREQVRRYIPFRGDISDHIDFLLYVWQRGKKLGSRIAFENILRNLVTRLISFRQTISILIIKENLSLDNGSCLPCQNIIISERQVEEDLQRRTALHMRQ